MYHFAFGKLIPASFILMYVLLGKINIHSVQFKVTFVCKVHLLSLVYL